MRLGYHPEPAWWNDLILGFRAFIVHLEHVAEHLHDKFHR